MIPAWILLDPAIPDRAIRIYAVLFLLSATGKPWPSRKELAGHCGVSIDSIDRALKTMVALGLVDVTHTFRADSGAGPNTYRLRFDKPDDRGRDTGGTGVVDG